MIVVADTGPINYLVLIGNIDVLPALYRRVLVPVAVQRELLHAKTPQAVRDFMTASPEWLEIRSLGTPSDPTLSELDTGEAEAISLAEQVKADRIVIDESLGRRVAESHGLHVIGTLGVLREASNRGLLDLRQAVERLQNNRFHIAQNILDDILSGS
jgi:predicted nucleic acid-binding protein